jgi:nitrate reductase gamma subunit
MIIIWKGAGGLVIIIGILACLFMNIITSALFNRNDYFQVFLWPKVAALWITGVSCWCLGRYLNGKPGRALIDKATGEEFYEKPNHHLMFIKMEYWGVIFVVIGLALLVVRIVNGSA